MASLPPAAAKNASPGPAEQGKFGTTAAGPKLRWWSRYDSVMADNSSGGASEGAAQTQQPGVTSADLGGDIDRVDPDDIEVTSPDEVAPPATAPDESAPTVNADLVDDPEEMARAVEAASGQSVEVVEASKEAGHEGT